MKHPRRDTPGIILRKIARAEGDLLLTVLSLKYGKIHLYARGARSSLRRFGGVVDVFDHALFSFTTKEDSLGFLEQATPYHPNYAALRDSLDKLIPALTLAEVYDFMTLGHAADHHSAEQHATHLHQPSIFTNEPHPSTVRSRLPPSSSEAHSGPPPAEPHPDARPLRNGQACYHASEPYILLASTLSAIAAAEGQGTEEQRMVLRATCSGLKQLLLTEGILLDPDVPLSAKGLHFMLDQVEATAERRLTTRGDLEHLVRRYNPQKISLSTT